MYTGQTRPVGLITSSGRRRVGNLVARDLAEQGYSIALHYHSSEEATKVATDDRIFISSARRWVIGFVRFW